MPKSWFDRTDKKNYEVQLSQIERRQARLASIRAKLDATASTPPAKGSSPVSIDDLKQPPSSKYVIGVSRKSPIDLCCFAPILDVPHIDPYLKVSSSSKLLASWSCIMLLTQSYHQDTIPKLKQHLLPRILGRLGYSSAEAVKKCDWMNVAFLEGRIFSHKLMKIHYTTYDIRPEKDVIHLETPQCHVMLLDPDNGGELEHPYRYARVIGIFHANVSYVGQLPDGTSSYASHQIDFCWAHWYTWHKALDEFALERASPHPLNSPVALGFFDPIQILRAVHLIPQFSLKRMDKVGPVKSRWDSKYEIWNTYFINRSVA
jgi:hypothetical protein